MRIGSFYGITAPMLVVVADDEVTRVLEDFNTKLNNIAASDIQKELWHFYHNLTTIKPNLELAEDTLSSYAQRATVSEGNIVGSVSDDERSEILGGLVDNCAKKLYEQLLAGRYKFDLSSLEDSTTFRSSFTKMVLEAMQAKSFALTNLGSLYRSLTKKLQSTEMLGDVELVKENIKATCLLKESLPQTFFINGEEIKLNADEYKVLTYYYEKRDIVKRLQQSIQVLDQDERTVFGVPFIDFLNRKPTCLYYMIVNQFDHLKNSDIRLLPNILEKVRAEFSVCKELIESRLVSNEVTLNLINQEDLADTFVDESSDFLDFMNDVYSELAIAAINYDDILKLRVLFYATNYLTLANLNATWGTNFDSESFNQLISKMNQIYLGGINLHTAELYRASLREIIFTNEERINKKDDYLVELMQICTDIEAFLSTFKPIGGALDV